MDLVTPLLFVATGAVAAIALDRLGVMIPDSSWGGIITVVDDQWFRPAPGPESPGWDRRSPDSAPTDGRAPAAQVEATVGRRVRWRG